MRRDGRDSRTAVGQAPLPLARLALLALVVLPATPRRGGEISNEIDSTRCAWTRRRSLWPLPSWSAR